MREYFRDYGRALLANGYLIVPIKPGEKRPALVEWQRARLGAADLGGYPGCGVGVLCGQGAAPVVGVDVDTTNVLLADAFADWCRENLGATCERVGNAPRVLLAYRAAGAGWPKQTGAWFDDADGARHRVEILGAGQQFVAYHTHPDTGRPYEWVDMLGGLEALRAGDLPVVTTERLAQALVAFEGMATAAGLVRAGAPPPREVPTGADDLLTTYEPPVGLAAAELRELLTYVDNSDYDTWLKAGMALHHECGGSADGLALWDGWSSTADNYAGRGDLAKRWSGFGRSGRAPTTARWLIMAGRAGRRDVQRQEKRGALDDARGRILACTDSIDLVGAIARHAGDAAGDDLAIRAELAGLIRARFKELTDTPLPIADVRAAMASGRVASAPGGARQRRAMTEFGNAERMLDHYGAGLMYVPELDAWHTWTGVYWRRAAGVELEHLAKETIRALPDEVHGIEGDDERAAFFRFCAASQRAQMVQHVVRLAASDPRVVVGVAALDNRPHLLGVGNGAVDLRTGELLPPDPTHRITIITPVEYDARARCPLFEQTVADAFFGDVGLVEFLQRLLGYALLGQPNEDVLAIPYGEGSNGKSTILGAVREALGGHARLASADTFLTSGTGTGAGAGAAREDVLRLRGARFVYISEPDRGSELREGLIKSMTGGEPMPARGLYSRATVEVLPTWVAVMPTNHLPIIKGEDHAIWRRLLPVPFTRNYDHDPAVEKDPHRDARLRTELPGILAWCVRGALAYQRGGLQPPGAVRGAREAYRTDMDLLAEWLDECCELRADCVESTAVLWASWEAFAKSRGVFKYIATAKSLGRRLQSRGLQSVRDTRGLRGRGFAGVRVRGFDA